MLIIQRVILSETKNIVLVNHKINNSYISFYYLRLKAMFLICLAFLIKIT